MPMIGHSIPRWITSLTSAELLDVMETTSEYADALHASGRDTHGVDAIMDDLMAEHGWR